MAWVAIIKYIALNNCRPSRLYKLQLVVYLIYSWKEMHCIHCKWLYHSVFFFFKFQVLNMDASTVTYVCLMSHIHWAVYNFISTSYSELHLSVLVVLIIKLSVALQQFNFLFHSFSILKLNEITSFFAHTATWTNSCLLYTSRCV